MKNLMLKVSNHNQMHMRTVLDPTKLKKIVVFILVKHPEQIT